MAQPQKAGNPTAELDFLRSKQVNTQDLDENSEGSSALSSESDDDDKSSSTSSS